MKKILLSMLLLAMITAPVFSIQPDKVDDKSISNPGESMTIS